MIKIMKISQAWGVDALTPKLLPDDEMTREGFAAMLKGMLAQNKDITFIRAAVSEENDEVVGFLIAFAPPNVPYTFILQAWLKPGQDVNVSDLVFSRLEEWTRQLGRKEIQANTKRDPRAFARRWKFEVVSQIISHRLSIGEVEDEFGGQDGQRTEDGVDANVEPEANRERHLELDHADKDSGGSDTLLGTDSGSTGSGIRSGSESDPKLQPDAVSGSGEPSGQQAPVGDTGVQSE